VLGLHGLFERAYDFLKGIKETREVKSELKNVLQSMTLYSESSKACQNSGMVLRTKIESLNLTRSISPEDWESIVNASTTFANDYRVFLQAY
jgi:hypothetical protein